MVGRAELHAPTVRDVSLTDASLDERPYDSTKILGFHKGYLFALRLEHTVPEHDDDPEVLGHVVVVLEVLTA